MLINLSILNYETLRWTITHLFNSRCVLRIVIFSSTRISYLILIKYDIRVYINNIDMNNNI